MDITYTGLASGRKRKVRAFVYIMHEDRPLGIPTQRYLDVCREGYADFGFDEGMLMTALTDSIG